MRSNYKRLGKYIRQIDVRNTENKTDNLLGVSVQKCFIPSIANTVGTDFSKYKVVKKGQFTYIPDTSRRGDKIGIALLNDYDEGLVSNVYTVFEIIDEKELDPTYLMLWFNRPEFDRYARFKSQGSVREVFDWDEMCNVELPVPSYDEQRKIVDAYKAIERRIELKKKINDNLEAQAFAIYKNFIEGSEASTDLSDIATITMGTSPEGESFNTDELGDVFYQGRTDFGFRFPTIRLYTTEGKRYAKAGDVLMSVRAPVGDVNIAKEDCAIGRGLASIRPKDGCYSFLYYTMQELNFELKKFNDEGTVFGSITKDDLFALKIVPLDSQRRNEFESVVAPIDALIKANEYEIFQLQDVCSTLLSQLTH